MNGTSAFFIKLEIKPSFENPVHRSRAVKTAPLHSVSHRSCTHRSKKKGDFTTQHLSFAKQCSMQLKYSVTVNNIAIMQVELHTKHAWAAHRGKMWANTRQRGLEALRPCQHSWDATHRRRSCIRNINVKINSNSAARASLNCNTTKQPECESTCVCADHFARHHKLQLRHAREIISDSFFF